MPRYAAARLGLGNKPGAKPGHRRWVRSIDSAASSASELPDTRLVARGEITCELQDQGGRALPGFTMNESVPMTRNGLKARVAWAGGTTLSSLGAEQAIRLRFVMEDAWLYSFQFE